MATELKTVSKPKQTHKMHMEDRKNMGLTGITDVISFDLNKILLESDYGVLTIKGNNLHVSRLSVEKGELDVDGRIDSIVYSDAGSYSKKNESIIGRLLR